MEVRSEVLKELQILRERMGDVLGSSVASTDGLLIAHDMPEVEPDSLAAMSASYLALGQRLAAVLARGEFRDTATQASEGNVGVYAAGDTALLTVVTGPGANIGRMHLEARRSAERIGAIVDQAVSRLS